MKNRVRDHIRSNVVGYVALFFALTGGAAWATHPGGANTISSADIIDETIRRDDIRANAVQNAEIDGNAITSAKISNGGVTTDDVRNDNLRSEDIFDGQIKAIDVAFGTLRGDEIQDGTIGGGDLADNDVKGVDIDESTLGQVPSAANASNANSLGGVPASAYYDGCDTGAIHGFAYINGSATFSSTFTTVGVQNGFNCAGGTVEARRVDEGTYRVRFNGNGSLLALGVVDAGSDAAIGRDNFISIERVNDGGTAFQVSLVDDGGSEQDTNFTILIF